MKPFQHKLSRLCILTGLIFFMISGKDLYNGFNSYFWPTANAEIVKLVSQSSESDTPLITSLKYTYQVGKNRFTGENIQYGMSSPISQELAHNFENYKSGDTLTIHYNPNHPGQSVVLKGLSLKILWQMMAGTLTLVYGIILVWIKTTFRKLFSSLVLVGCGSGFLTHHLPIVINSILNDQSLPFMSSATSLIGTGLSWFGIRRLTSSLNTIGWSGRNSSEIH